MTLDEYCRELEAYLCRRNGGHLVRISGPAFEVVREWGRAGIPLRVAMQGIDRRLERMARRGGQQRPLRIEFCDADVRRAFDEWRRAVGLRAQAREGGEDWPEAVPASRRRSLASHIERVIARLTTLRSGDAAPAWAVALEAAVRNLDALSASARTARGEAREAIVESLTAIDLNLLDAARRTVSAEVAAEVAEEAARQLEPFRERLRPDAWHDAVERGSDVVLRERLGLPAVLFD